jgi:hypothetical protein
MTKRVNKTEKTHNLQIFKRSLAFKTSKSNKGWGRVLLAMCFWQDSSKRDFSVCLRNCQRKKSDSRTFNSL